ncbi:hypothetical protein C8J56DRAFT_1053977 [Mycena floridula]|nr:hypothetical protein C8J56DRAFT_1053977 [Mycena floridula]
METNTTDSKLGCPAQAAFRSGTKMALDFEKSNAILVLAKSCYNCRKSLKLLLPSQYNIMNSSNIQNSLDITGLEMAFQQIREGFQFPQTIDFKVPTNQTAILSIDSVTAAVNLNSAFSAYDWSLVLLLSVAEPSLLERPKLAAFSSNNSPLHHFTSQCAALLTHISALPSTPAALSLADKISEAMEEVEGDMLSPGNGWRGVWWRFLRRERTIVDPTLLSPTPRPSIDIASRPPREVAGPSGAIPIWSCPPKAKSSTISDPLHSFPHRNELPGASKKHFRYGLALEDVVNPLPQSSLDNPHYLYPLRMLHQGPPPDPAPLEPNPVLHKPPHGFVWPIAPIYERNEHLDPRYRCGYFYSTNISSASDDKEAEMARLSKIATPPGVEPIGYDTVEQKFLMVPVEGMIELPVGIPLVGHIDGDPSRSVTITCLHTLDSVMAYAEGPQINILSRQLWDEMWGTANKIPFFKLDGLMGNYRSAELQEDRADGSYTLGSSFEEGRGNQGWLHPAVQSNNPQYLHRAESMLSIIQQLIRLIVPLCTSKLEWNVWEFRAEDLNVMTFGGLEPGLTGLQMNVSSS